MLPTVVPEIAYGLLWLWLLNPLYGPITSAAHARRGERPDRAGTTPPQWLTDPTDARAA